GGILAHPLIQPAGSPTDGDLACRGSKLVVTAAKSVQLRSSSEFRPYPFVNYFPMPDASSPVAAGLQPGYSEPFVRTHDRGIAVASHDSAPVLTISDLGQILHAVDPSVLMVPPRFLRRFIRTAVASTRAGLQVPHRKSLVCAGEKLLQIA